MKTVIDDAGTTCTIHLSDSTLSVANGLRRACLANVPTLAFERLKIVHNTSGQADEVLAHRLGLITLCGSGEPADATLDVTCDTASQVVTMRDFVWPETLMPVHPDTPLVELERGQRLCIAVTAQWGTGRDHAKWNACSRVALKHGSDTGSYDVVIDSRQQHPALAVASIALEQTIASIQEMIEDNK